MNTRVVVLLAASLVLADSTFAADPIAFDYKPQSAEKSLPYSKNLAVTLTAVNVFDYRYTVGEVKVGLPGPINSSTAYPRPATGWGYSAGRQDHQLTTDQCLGILNENLPDRVKLFGDKALATWHETLIEKLAPCSAEFVAAWRDVLAQAGDVKNPGTKLLDSPDINKKAADTGPGGWIEIPVQAAAFVPKVSNTGGSDAIALKIDQVPLTTPPNTDVTDHLAPHVFRIKFEAPQGIASSLGPFVSTLQQRSWARVADPVDSSKFVVGLSEDSSISYGVAAYWNVDAINLNDHADWLSFCWGIAYTPQSQVEQSIAGLLGVGWHVRKTPLFLQLGAAIGVAHDLSGGLTVGKPIGANQEITTTSHVRASLFLGMSFIVSGAPR